MERCRWADGDPLLEKYHDTEWGMPLFDDRLHFEALSLEVMQCGLSWMTVLRKREALRAAFSDFDPAAVSKYDSSDVDRIIRAENVIRSERKIRAVISNAKAFLRIQDEFESFSRYIWSFTEGKVMRYPEHADGNMVARNELSDTISSDLKSRGFSFLGSVTVYSYLQSVGIINDHMSYCFCYAKA